MKNDDKFWRKYSIVEQWRKTLKIKKIYSFWYNGIFKENHKFITH